MNYQTPCDQKEDLLLGNERSTNVNQRQEIRTPWNMNQLQNSVPSDPYANPSEISPLILNWMPVHQKMNLIRIQFKTQQHPIILAKIIKHSKSTQMEILMIVISMILLQIKVKMKEIRFSQPMSSIMRLHQGQIV